jgi:hypothetical protein
MADQGYRLVAVRQWANQVDRVGWRLAETDDFLRLAIVQEGKNRRGRFRRPAAQPSLPRLRHPHAHETHPLHGPKLITGSKGRRSREFHQLFGLRISNPG